MMGFFVLLVATLASIELMRATAVIGTFAILGRQGRRAMRLLPRTGVSEWAKERALRIMAFRLMATSLSSGLRLVIVAAPILFVLAIDARHSFGLHHTLFDWRARLWLLVLTGGYVMIRRPGKPGPSDRGERLLQRVALGSVPILDLSFTIERRLYARAIDVSENAGAAPVFVAGLARAGTSILMRSLHQTGAFASLTYRDLPFPLAPNSWARLGGGAHRPVALAERGHGDGLLDDLDTPEAIEEVFWRCHEGDRYRHRHGLASVAPMAATLPAFRDYVELVRTRYGRDRYLSKNNNNLLRLPALVDAFPDAHLVHPFRDPIEHAASLHEQHVRACTLAQDDPFRARFMGWLGHHEFGADQRPFLLPGAPAPDEDRTRIDYWLKLWISVYGFLLDQPAPVRRRQIFLDFDELCAAPRETAGVLAAKLGMDQNIDLGALRVKPSRSGRRAAPDLVGAARALHGRLRQVSEVRGPVRPVPPTREWALV